MTIKNAINLTYTTLSLRRDNMSRRPDDWVAEHLERGVGVVPVCGSLSLITTGDAPTAYVFEGEQAHQIIELGSQSILLGTDDHKPFFAVAVNEAVAPEIEGMTSGSAGFIDIRAVGPLLPPIDAHLLAHARGMCFGTQSTGIAVFAAEKPSHATMVTNGNVQIWIAARAIFPRTDPAIIVLVYRDDVPGGACLLGRHARWPFGMYSTLAGFVEPGETMEQAVSREVFEESNIETTDVTYLASQPWPFPASLMMGFHARATSYDIAIGDEELSDCRWFSRDDIASMKEWVDAKDDDLRLPRQDSISRWLIQQWIDQI